MSITDPTKPIGIVYAEEKPDGTFLFGVGPADFELLRQGYGCMNCLEKFLIGGSLVQLPRCPLCREPVEAMIDPVPEDWAAYIAEKKAEMDEPAKPRRR